MLTQVAPIESQPDSSRGENLSQFVLAHKRAILDPAGLDGESSTVATALPTREIRIAQVRRRSVGQRKDTSALRARPQDEAAHRIPIFAI
jgi:hypothetical protein